MPTSHLLRTVVQARRVQFIGDLIEGRGTGHLNGPFTVPEQNFWAVVACPDIEPGDPLTDPDGWWNWWETHFLDPALLDAWAQKRTLAVRRRLAFVRKRVGRRLGDKAHRDYKATIDSTRRLDVPWAELKTLCSRRVDQQGDPLPPREDLRPDFWEAIADGSLFQKRLDAARSASSALNGQGG